jgi:hypothetical protein
LNAFEFNKKTLISNETERGEENKVKSIEKIIEDNNNYQKTKKHLLESEKEHANLNNISNLTMKIGKKGNVKLGNNSNIKLNFDYKKNGKDNMPITLMSKSKNN